MTGCASLAKSGDIALPSPVELESIRIKATNNPDNYNHIVQGKEPTIREYRAKYGDEQVTSIIGNYIFVVNENMTHAKMDAYNILTSARLLMNKLNNFNLYEVGLFFSKVIEGEYGDFYGSLDTVKLNIAASKFIEWSNERASELIYMEDKKKAKEDYRKSIETMATPEERRRIIKESGSGLLQALAEHNNW